MGCSIDAAAKKTRARTTYQLKVLVLQRAHWQPPQPVAREFHDCDSDPMPVHEIQLQRDPPVHREVRPRGGLRARALRLPVRHSYSHFSSLMFFEGFIFLTRRFVDLLLAIDCLVSWKQPMLWSFDSSMPVCTCCHAGKLICCLRISIRISYSYYFYSSPNILPKQ